MVTKAAVLCGGEGTRLKPHTNDRQKTMIPVGNKGRPLLEYIVRLLAYNEVNEITLLTGYRSEQVEAHFGDGGKFGVRINYSKDAEGVKGSAPALVNAVDGGRIGAFDDLVIYYGDVLSALNIRELVAHHRDRGAAMTLVLSKDYRVPVGIAQVEGESVTSFEEKPVLPLNVTVGCLVISKGCLPLLRQVTSAGGNDIMTHFVPKVIAQGMKVSAFYIEGFWYDVGTTEAYEKLDSELVEKNLRFLD
ncbi:MAG: nucleotidyltransferase family protein [Thaumarchaeota archaeon]|nr:nucleotidyltransferase family protein [Nitrososphaerota archaeon]